ncbi:DNA-binding protein [Paenarthrobacter sp. Z7-10]|uniref:DNA-binding protein n=1 Tax=Paenarthrobacter sp. Z7-10 TaxID=2787635 RepID=UPI0022A91447|nr:DNA-binding protein [Paenarthrobacter sp. Z7-10]MCZ2404850.1 DNA-binding protein [Paenarthrobacter sp. Z7-10]
MSVSAKERVFAAAEKVSSERAPTVASVREVAGVSMADASRFLREWKSDREESTRQVVAAPPSVTEYAQKLAGGVWGEAVRLAGEQHAGLQAQWAEEKAVLTKEIDELVATADATDAAHRAEMEEAAKALSVAQALVGAAEEKAGTAMQTAEVAVLENSELRVQLAAAQATSVTLQSAMDAVLARIPAAGKSTGKAK